MPRRAFSFPRAARGDRRHLAGQRAAVGVAQDDEIRAGLLRRLPRRQGVIGIILVSVESVLRIVNDELPVVLQEAHRVADHRQVLLRRRPQDFLHVQQPGLAEDRDHGRMGFEQQPDLVVALDRDTLAPRRTERRQPGVLELLPFGLGKELDVLGIGPRPAALDVMNPERVEPLGDAQLVHHREVDAFTLAAVAQSRIVYFHFGFHKYPR